MRSQSFESTLTTRPDLRKEAQLFAEGFGLVGGIDEVGRGSAFGPCCVGVVVVDEAVATFPQGLRDSKLLSAVTREGLIEPLRRWAKDFSVGEASAREIDDFGLTCALRLAGRRALSQLAVQPEVLLLDGQHDWLSTPKVAPLFSPPYPDVNLPDVRTLIKADVTCASVAAASVFAKVHRDQLIRELAARVPGYDLANNKGYATAAHLSALRRLGPSAYHRVSWRLPERDVVTSAT